MASEVYDRGTVFGLKMLASGVGRVESDVAARACQAMKTRLGDLDTRWEYAYEPGEGTPEAKIMKVRCQSRIHEVAGLQAARRRRAALSAGGAPMLRRQGRFRAPEEAQRRPRWSTDDFWP